MKFGTKAIHAGLEPDSATGAIMTPIYQTSTYVQDGIGTRLIYWSHNCSRCSIRFKSRMNSFSSEFHLFLYLSKLIWIKCSRLDSNQHVLKRTPAPQAGVSTNFTT